MDAITTLALFFLFRLLLPFSLMILIGILVERRFSRIS